MKTTCYAKYDAHKRYSRLNNTSLFALTSASLLLIFIGIISKGSTCLFLNSSSLEIFSIMVSIIILVLSLVVSFASYTLKSERYLRAGNELNNLYDKFSIVNRTCQESIDSIIAEYAILRQNVDNHQAFNYTRGRLARKKEIGDEICGDDNTSFLEDLEYWIPIISFYFISLFSFSTFLFIIIKYINHA